MAALRHVGKKDTDVPEADLEAPRGQESPAEGVASALRGSHQNPVFLAKAIFRKVVDLLSSESDEDVSILSIKGILFLLRDVVLGIVGGIIVISLLVFLDHRNIIHLESAHNFRTFALTMLNDPETIQNLEESSDLKFLTVDVYEHMREEIDGAEAKIASVNDMLERRTKEAEEKQKELDSIEAEYDSLYGNPLLGLNAFCAGCMWANRLTCAQRVAFLKDTYNTRTISAKLGAMELPSCVSK